MSDTPSKEAMEAAGAIECIMAAHRMGVVTGDHFNLDRRSMALALDAFAARAVLAEREACAAMCEQLEIANPFTLPMKEKLRIFDALNQAAAAIRARGSHEKGK